LPRLDEFHVDTPGLKEVGSRLALAAQALVHGRAAAWTGPRFDRACFADSGRRQVLVTFSHVAGYILPEMDIRGFEVVGREGACRPLTVARAADDSQAAVLITLEQPAPAEAWVRYGFGRQPDANLTDASGLPAPVFAEQRIAAAR